MTATPTAKALAIAALTRAQEEARRSDGANLMVLGYLLEDAKIRLEAVEELKTARRKPKAGKVAT